MWLILAAGCIEYVNILRGRRGLSSVVGRSRDLISTYIKISVFVSTLNFPLHLKSSYFLGFLGLSNFCCRISIPGSCWLVRILIRTLVGSWRQLLAFGNFSEIISALVSFKQHLERIFQHLLGRMRDYRSLPTLLESHSHLPGRQRGCY